MLVEKTELDLSITPTTWPSTGHLTRTRFRYYWLAKKFIQFFLYDGSLSSAQLSLTSFETILFDCIVTAVISACIKKNIKIGEFLCNHFNIEDLRK